MKAIVLAAGRGKRLLPITSNRPKHLLEIAGRSILKRILDDLLNENYIEEIFVVIHYYSELIEKSIRNWYSKSSELKKIIFVHQLEPLGTGDAVHSALKQFKNPYEAFMVIYGDLILGDAITNMILEYKKKTISGVLVLGVTVKDPEKFGILEIEEGSLVSITEKMKNPPKSSLINGGVYIFPKDAVSMISKIGFSERNEKELTDVISSLIQDDFKIDVYQMLTSWFDIGHPWQLLDANEYLLNREKTNFQQLGFIEDGVTINGNIHVAKNAKIRSGTYIEGVVFIDEGADIGPNCYIRSNTYIGKMVRIGNACEIKNSILYNNTHAAHLSYVGDSILGENCNLGAGTITANLRHDGKKIKMTIKGKRENTGKRKLGVVMGDDVKTGIGVNILPGVKLSSNTWINAGETVSRDR